MAQFNLDGVSYSRFKDIPGAVYARSGQQYQQNASGVWVPFGDDQVPQLAGVGTEIWESRTNYIPNPAFSGSSGGKAGTNSAGIIGSVPNRLSIRNDAPGVTITIVEKGVEFGLPYLDLDFSGTVPATSTWLRLFWEGASQIAAANGIHFSGSTGAKATFNYVKNATLLGAATDHADGCIIFSNATGDSIIANNYCENGIGGIASIDSSDNSSVIISGNVIKSCTTYAIEGNFPSANTGGKVSITGNLIYNSVALYLNYTLGTYSATTGPHNWLIQGNYLENTRLQINGGGNVIVNGNEVYLPNDITNACITITNANNVVACDNLVREGINGFWVNTVNNVKIIGNHCRNNYLRGINFGVGGRGNSVESNTVIVETGYVHGASYIGINAVNDLVVIGNVMDLQVAANGSPYGISCPNGAASQNGAIVANNTIRSVNLTASIKTYGGSLNNVIVNNFVQQAIANSGGAGNPNVTGNVTIF